MDAGEHRPQKFAHLDGKEASSQLDPQLQGGTRRKITVIRKTTVKAKNEDILFEKKKQKRKLKGARKPRGDEENNNNNNNNHLQVLLEDG